MLTGIRIKLNRARILYAFAAIAAAACAGGQPSGEPLQTVRGPSPKQAFADGYQAYTQHDYGRAIQQLGIAATGNPDLGDYALFYLARAERESGDLPAATKSAHKLIESYPQSLLAARAQVELAQIAIKEGQPAQAREIAERVLARGGAGEAEKAARLAAAEAAIALGDNRTAYRHLQALRHDFPHSEEDREARQIVARLGIGVESHREEAELLIKEGAGADALREIEAALSEGAGGGSRGELLWMRARLLHSEPSRAKEAFEEYLSADPSGPHAPEARFQLARIYWHEGENQAARREFERVVNEFPSSGTAAQAMMSLGRLAEEDNQPGEARNIYTRLAARYPGSDDAAEARFRASWMLYQAGDFRAAAEGFAQARSAASQASERDRLTYWQARALEKNGDGGGARSLFQQVASSVDSNYYPLLAARRLGGSAANVSTSSSAAATAPPAAAPQVGGAAGFHLVRASELGSLGLNSLEVGELKALRDDAGSDPAVRDFVLSEFQRADDWRDAMALASQMVQRGALSADAAERIRYPRAYWNIIAADAQRQSIDPYLVAALSRQESLFDPEARSGSDARGLMQLLPTTAARVAGEGGAYGADQNLYDPALNVQLGTSYLRQLLGMFGQDTFMAVAAYNAGEHAVERWNTKFHGDDDEWVENIDYHETRDYVKKVVGGVREYQLLYGGSASSI